MIFNFLQKIKSDFLKNFLTLLSGSILAQLIVVSVSPFLTRLYEPVIFGTSALFMSIVNILSIAVTGRYEMAIIQTKRDYDGLSLLIISLLLSISFSLFGYFLYYIFFQDLQYIDKLNNQLSGYLLFIPLLVIFVVLIKTFNNYLNRNKYYESIAVNQVSLSLFQSIGKIVFGLSVVFSNGLIVGTIIGQAITSLFIILRYSKNYFSKIKFLKAMLRIKYNLIKYKNFPKILLISDSINVIGYQLPFILSSSLYSLEKLGYLSLAYSMSSMPLTVVGTSISRVFRQRMSEEYNNTGSCDKIFKRLLQKIILLITIPFILIYFFAPWIFEFVFGSQWKESGEIVQILLIMFYFQFIARNFAYMYILSDHQKDNLYIQLVLLFGVLVIFSVGGWMSFKFQTTLLLFSLFYSFMYIYVIIQSYKFSKG
ncbi:MAG TPA: hypothetical protein ENK66_07745 [Arcobacter sp.]|nr:hypothetical protein [Arcobacter sp.]